MTLLPGRSAAWLAHQTGGLGVAGSNPVAPMKRAAITGGPFSFYGFYLLRVGKGPGGQKWSGLWPVYAQRVGAMKRRMSGLLEEALPGTLKVRIKDVVSFQQRGS